LLGSFISIKRALTGTVVLEFVAFPTALEIRKQESSRLEPWSKSRMGLFFLTKEDVLLISLVGSGA
jgi:hypothetical protein